MRTTTPSLLPGPVSGPLPPGEAGSMAEGTDLELRIANDEFSTIDHTLQAQYEVWIQTLKNHPISVEGGVYLSTFQQGRGQHITALDTSQARVLGERLIALAEEIELEVEVNRVQSIVDSDRINAAG